MRSIASSTEFSEGCTYRLEIVIELRNPAEADQHSWVIPITIPA